MLGTSIDIVILIGHYNLPIEIHFSSSMSFSPVKRDFDLFDNSYSYPTSFGALDLNSDFVGATQSIGIPTSVDKENLDLCQDQVHETAVTIIDKCKSISMSKPISENIPTSLPSVSDPMSIDSPVHIHRLI